MAFCNSYAAVPEEHRYSVQRNSCKEQLYGKSFAEAACMAPDYIGQFKQSLLPALRFAFGTADLPVQKK